jgi:hypothetical protein
MRRRKTRKKITEQGNELSESKKVVPRDEPLLRTDQEIDEMCSTETMEALMGEAADDFRENAPSQYKGLLDTKEQSDA